jgi:hypothetical protein
VRVEFGRGEALVELKVDGASARVEAEFAVGPVVVFPTAVGVRQQVVRQLLHDIFERKRPHLDLRVVPGQCGIGDLGLGESDFGVASVGFDAFNLAAIAIAVKAHGHMGDARGSQAIEEALLVGRTQSCDPHVTLGLPSQHGSEINPGRRHRRGQGGFDLGHWKLRNEERDLNPEALSRPRRLTSSPALL